MRLLVSWLRDFVDVPADPPTLARTLSMCGFEVASIEPPPAAVVRPDGSPVEGPDAVIDFEITANRPDCLSVAGLAREAATAFDRPTHAPAASPGAFEVIRAGTTASAHGLAVSIDAPDLCPRYAVAVADVRVGPSPAWLAARLEAAGVRPINNVVDVTNYVLIETGHPLHAFDLDRLEGATLRIRRSAPGERLRTLDGEARELQPDMLVIADATHAQAVGGVMGGATSEVSPSTRRVALESAWFRPASIRRTSKRLGLKTEASTRFERGADIGAPVAALSRALALLDQIGAGTVAGPILDCCPSDESPAPVTLRRARIERVLGHGVDDATVERVLTALGFGLERGHDGWRVGVPTWRVDVSREIDLVEEIARHDGYDRVGTTFPPLDRAPSPPDPRIERARLARRVLTAAGFSEAITFSFIDARDAASFAGTAPTVGITYPLSESMAVMRPSLLPGLIDALAHNRRRMARDVRLFELGACFDHSRGEQRRLALAWTGAAAPEHWSRSGRPADLFDVKGVMELLADALRVAPAFVPSTRSWLVPGRTADLVVAGEVLGVLGQLHPSLAVARDLPAADAVFVAEIGLEALAAHAESGEVRFQPLPRHPAVVRDLSVVVDEGLAAGRLRETAREAAPPWLSRVVEFDRYQGKGIPEGRVSLSLRLTFRASDCTLTDAEVQTATDAILAALVSRHGAVQR